MSTLNTIVPPASEITATPEIEESSYGVYIRIAPGAGFALEDADVARAYEAVFAEAARLLDAQAADREARRVAVAAEGRGLAA